MNKYYIKELETELTYLELRILTYMECEQKILTLTKILNFLNANRFLTNLTMMYHMAMRSENLVEKQDAASLSIDMRDEKFRFKYWDGSKTYWAYHVDDLFNILVEGRKEYQDLVKKYNDVTLKLLETKQKYPEVNRITYNYYPSDDIDIQYDIQFTKDMEDNKAKLDMILKEIFDYIPQNEDLKIDIIYSFKKPCIPCQKKKERENEQSNKENHEH